MRLEVRIDRAAIAGLFRAGADIPQALGRGVQRVLVEGGNQITLQIRRGGALNPRSGLLGKAWTPGTAKVKVEFSGSAVEGSLSPSGPGEPYAAIQNYGGEVRAKNAAYLAIPLAAAKTGAGVSRWASPRQVPDAFVIRSKAKALLIVRRAGDGLEPLFVLKESVRVPPSGYVDKAIVETQKVAQPIVDAALQQSIDAAMKGAA